MGKKSGKRTKAPPPRGGKKTWKQKLAEKAFRKARGSKHEKDFKPSWWEVEDPLYAIDEETFEVIEVRASSG